MSVSIPQLNRANPELLTALSNLVGPKGVIEDPIQRDTHLTEWRDLYHGDAAIVLAPGSTREVSEIVKLCAAAQVGVTPQGGNTGLVGGQIPFHGEVLISLSRMNAIKSVDPLDNTLTAEAGVILQTVQEAADGANRYFPLSLASEGSCQLGGLISSNAGGTAVLRYGNMRELVLGIEAVLPDGEIWNGLRRLRKNNTGYDLKHLFIGGEGTLGIVTTACLKLFPRITERATTIAAFETPENAIACLSEAQAASGGALSAFELISRPALECAIKHIAGVRDPLDEAHPWYALMEFSTSGGQPVGDQFEKTLERWFEQGTIVDAALAQNEDQSQQFWRLRESLSEAQKGEGGSIKHDVSVPVASIPEFLKRADAAVEKVCPGARPTAFGHAGDGNIHYNVSQPVEANRDAYLAKWNEMSEAVHDVVHALEGSISAEHGLGVMKRDENTRYKPAAELSLMRAVKHALDPQGIMNPGKLIKQ